ncbi:MAG: 6-phosphogluconate dehydrogenase [Algibacter sp.]|uniref:6-phosphogluconate dehydrogenase n=1 Tax=Algibacter sp. TaxID=1872428 RepID=UPI0032986BB2
MKFLFKTFIAFLLIVAGYFSFISFVHYNEGVRASKLVKISSRGMLFKIWEGEISQELSESQIFIFSVEDHQKEGIEDLTKCQDKFVKL